MQTMIKGEMKQMQLLASKHTD